VAADEGQLGGWQVMSVVDRIPTQWALMSKRPGSSDDYHVLECSQGPLQRAAFDRVIRRFLPGTPSRTPSPSPDSLPWVTFGPTGDGGTAYAGVAVLEWSDQVDWSGRPVAPTRYFCLPFEELAGVRASYAGLYGAVAGLPLPRPDPGPLSLRPAGLDLDEAAERIDQELGFAWAAGVAALLLDGPVVLVTAGALPLGDRLDCLDAVAALLPYGLRSDLAASTWADSGVAHHLRLTFGRRARDGQQAVAWRAPAAPEAGTLLAREYLSLLVRLHGRHGTATIAEHLAGCGAPASFASPKRAVEDLRRLDRPFALWDRVHAGGAAPDEVRELFATGRHASLRPAERMDLLRYLLAQNDPEDLATVRQHWTPELLPWLVEAAHGLLLRGADRPLFTRYMEIADRSGQKEAFLLGLLDGAGAPGEAAARSAVIQVLRAEGVPAHGSWTRLRDRLGAPELAYELLAQEVEHGAVGRLPALLGWLRGEQDGAALRPFEVAAGTSPQPELSEAELAAVAEQGGGYAMALVEAASGFQRIDAVLPALSAWLARTAAELPEPERSGWERLLGSLPPAGPPARARIDLLLLLLGARPGVPLRRSLLDEGATAAGAYLEAFEAALRAPHLDRLRPLLARRLAERVAGERWAAPTALAANVLALLGIAVAQQPAPVAEPVAAVVADAVAADPELIRQPQYDAWWRAVIARYPVLASRTRAAELRRELAVVSSAAQAADLCADALLTGCGKRDVLGALAGCPVLDGPEAVHDFLLALLRRLLREGDDEFAWSTHSSMARAVLGNALGARLADSYRAWLAARAPDEIRCWVSLMELVGDAVDRQRLAGLTETAQRLRQLSFSRGQGSRRRWRWR